MLEFAFIAELLQSEVLLGLAFFGVTAALVAFCVPGVIIPLSLASGALLGPGTAIAVIIAGALFGSQAFFLVARNLFEPRLRKRLGPRLHWFDAQVSRHGALYIIGLRLVGAPHFLVTAGGALSSIRARTFALATMVGLMPVVAMAASAGSAV